MKVVVHPCDRKNASALYRLVWPAEALIQQGHDISIRYDIPYKLKRVRSRFADRLDMADQVKGIQGTVSGDVVVLQRPLKREWYEAMKCLQARGIAVVVEIDDLFSKLPLHNPVRRDCDPFLNPHENYVWLEKMCEIADWVTVTTDGLAEQYGGHGRVSVIPNYMPRWYTEIPRPDLGDRPVIGWTGSIHTHRGDLRVTKGAIGKAISLTDARIRVVGTGEGVAESLETPEPESTGWVDIDRYPLEMSKFDVGIVPLQSNPFNVSGKSWLKFLEFSSLGIPCIASPTRDNLKLAHMGIGFIAENPEEWLAESVSLLLDKGWREDQGAKARRYVRDHLTIEGNIHQWANAWRNAYAVRQGGLVNAVG